MVRQGMAQATPMFFPGIYIIAATHFSISLDVGVGGAYCWLKLHPPPSYHS